MVLMAGSAWAQEVNWAPGASVFVNTIGPQENRAEIENGIVQPTALASAALLPAVETHAFYNCWAVQCGPFAAVTFGGDDSLVSQIHGGFMIGLTDHFNVGVAYSLRPRGQVLREDFVLGSPAPENATDVKYVEQAITGVSIVLGIPLP